MTFESEELNIVAIYIWLLPASYVVFLTTLVASIHKRIETQNAIANISPVRIIVQEIDNHKK